MSLDRQEHHRPGQRELSLYDPDLWKNPNPVPFHFVPETPEPVIPNTMTETVIRDVQGEPVLVQDESWVEGFLNQVKQASHF